MEGRPAGNGLWAAWALALAGGVCVLIAAVLVTRADPDGVCPGGFPCSQALPAGATTLAIVGTAVAVVGGLIATTLAFRRLRPPPERGTSAGRSDGTGR